MNAACARCGSFHASPGPLCEACATREAALAALAAHRARTKSLARRIALGAGLSALVLDLTGLQTWVLAQDFAAVSWIATNTVPLALWAGLTLAFQKAWPAVFFVGWAVVVGLPVDYQLVAGPQPSERFVVIMAVAHLLQLFALTQVARLWRINRTLPRA